MLQTIDIICQRLDGELAKATHWQSCNSFRVFHGRGGCFPGGENFSVDIFFPAVLVTAFISCDEKFIQCLQQALLQRFKPLGFTAILFQYRSGVSVDNRVLYGSVPQNFLARYGPLSFKLSFSQQNLGYFLDIDPAREWLLQHAHGARVLNLFAYTCAFSVIASHAGAQAVVNIDLSAKSLAVGRENYQLNHLPLNNVRFFPHDIFRSWGKLKRFSPYDIVIVDPPSRQKGSFIESKDYERVWRRMPELVAEHGWLLTCLNSPGVLRSEFRRRAEHCLPNFFLHSELQPSEHFPELSREKGLKMLVFRRK